MAQKALNRALALFGPLEARIMRVIWTGQVGESFTVRDVQREMSELAYTTIMTTVVRLASKGLLHARASRQDVAQLVRRYGDAALIAFAARIEELDSEQRKRLRELGRQ